MMMLAERIFLENQHQVDQQNCDFVEEI